MVSNLDKHVDSLTEFLHFLNLLLQHLDMLMQGLQHLQDNEVVLMSQCISRKINNN